MKKTLFLFLLSLLIFSCGKETDPCEGVTCLNNGFCFNGGCDCPERWEGLDCSNQKTPNSVRVTNVKLNSFPFDNDGISWDVLDRADVYFQINEGTQSDGPLVFKSISFQNSSPEQMLRWQLITESVNLDPSKRYSIFFYDKDDLSADDYIGGLGFDAYGNNNGFPEVLKLENAAINIELEFQYIY